MRPTPRSVSATPTIAEAIPASWTARGRSPVAIPKTTGTIAEAPAIGATTDIVPVAIPR